MKKRMFVAFYVLGLLSLSISCFGQEILLEPSDSIDQHCEVYRDTVYVERDEAGSSFNLNHFDIINLGFGIGLGVNCLLDGEKEILESRLENGIVLVTDEEQMSKSLWLETNYIFNNSLGEMSIYPGIFFAVQISNENHNTLKSVAGGITVALKRTPLTQKNDKRSLNFGFGVSNTKIRVLNETICENKPLPVGMDEILFKRKNVWGLVGMISFRIF